MFHWGSAPPEKLKTIAVTGRVVVNHAKNATQNLQHLSNLLTQYRLMWLLDAIKNYHYT